MPNYLANRAFVSTAQMSSFVLDNTDEDMLGPFIVPIDTTDYRIFVWRRYSTSTVDNDLIFPANGPGRWIALASTNSNINTDDMIQFLDVATMKAYAETPSETMLYCLNTTPPVIYTWDSASTVAESGTDIVKISLLANGRMYKLYPAIVAPSSLTTVSSVAPTTIQTSGNTWVWAENDTITYAADVDGRYPNSLITYVSNGTIWIEVSANVIIYSGDPSTVGKAPNSIQEKWIDVSVTPSVRYGAIVDGSSVLSWEVI